MYVLMVEILAHIPHPTLIYSLLLSSATVNGQKDEFLSASVKILTCWQTYSSLQAKLVQAPKLRACSLSLLNPFNINRASAKALFLWLAALKSTCS